MGKACAGVLFVLMIMNGSASSRYIMRHLLQTESEDTELLLDSSNMENTLKAPANEMKPIHHSDNSHPYFLGVLQLCHPQGREMAGFEGLPPHGMFLDKTYMLVVSARGSGHHDPLEGFSTSSKNCHFSSQTSKSSEKILSYPQAVHNHKQLHHSKSGLHMFEMLAGSERCHDGDVTPFALSEMIKLGEFLARRYSQVLPALRKLGQDPTLASCIPEKDYFQSTSALLHGLLHEKQFTRVNIKKLERHIVRELGNLNSCPAIRDIKVFMERAYKEEKDVLKGKDAILSQQNLHQSLGLNDNGPSKGVVKSLSHWVCGEDGILCNGQKCLNLTQDNVGQLWNAIALHNSYLSSNSLFQSYALADTHVYIKKLLSWFTEDKSSDQVMKLDVVDDYFFLKVLTALGHHTQDPIMPTSRLVIEQYKKSKTKKIRFWRVLVNGKVVTEQLRSCAETASKGFCGFDTIRAHMGESVQKNTFSVCPDAKDEL